MNKEPLEGGGRIENMSARALNAGDFEQLKPKYAFLPSDWQSGGSQGMMSKKGSAFTVVKFIRTDGTEVRFFADRMAKDESGGFLVELAHFNTQMARADEWAKKGAKV